MRTYGICIGITAAWLSIGVALPGCQADSRGIPQITTGTETNWLQSCDSDAQCGNLSCECGVCTRRCSDDDGCNLPEAACSPRGSASVRTLCQGDVESGLCLPTCRETCEQGRSCVGGSCIPERGAGETTEPSSVAPRQGADAGHSSSTTNTSEPSQSEGSSANTATISSETSVDGATSTSSAAADAGRMCVLEEGPLTEGCCYRDEDCGVGQLCYQAVCAEDLSSPGRCATPPSAPNCHSERDCGAGELCRDGQLAACGTSGPDVLGTCVADCEFDSCHPERCDEVGEPCCDPLPGDGPNYCNAGLTCLAEGCAQAETTTPEAQARQLCEATGGDWVELSCGHYSCGRPPVCAALVPGCNCGAGRNYTTLGCAEDVSCETL